MNLVRYYNQNRKKIWGILIIIASAFLLLQLLNHISKINNEEKLAQGNNTAQEELGSNISTGRLTTNQSVITGKSLSNEQLKSETTVIDEFISYCNNKELEKAYDLLTDDCKEQMYDSLEVFEQAYYNDVFNGESKTCSIENWVNNIYQVRIVEDMLATGKSNNGYAKQDYITVEKVEGDYKLNINNYIGYTQIDKTTQQDNIEMKVLGKNTYMDYETYTIEVTNHTDKRILLDERLDVKSLFLQDSKGTKSSSYSHELTEAMLTVPANRTKKVTIKFYNEYVSTKKIEAIVFSDLLLYDSDLTTQKIEFKANV